MSQANQDKLKLMVVDDEPDNLDLLYRTFRREFKVYRADSGAKALALLDQEGEMGIIISDQRMPGMNGTELLGKIVDHFPDTIRILLTGYTDVEDLVEAINAGKVFKYITKPWNPEQLQSVIKQAAETYRYTKQRTLELRHSLQRESVLNAIITAIRESLDYRNMLSTIVKTLAQTLEVDRCVIGNVSNGIIEPELYTYPPELSTQEQTLLTSWFTSVLQSHQIEIEKKDITRISVPLICQQELLAILSLERVEKNQTIELEHSLVEVVAQQAALALSQAKLYQQTQEQAQKMREELELARQIQYNLLRQTLPTIAGVRIQACCYPARQVGGDLFEVYHHPQGDLWLAVGDVSGKGVPAALFMASAVSLIRRELAQETSPEPIQVIHNLNAGLYEDLMSSNCFITLILARYRLSTGQLSYANAGHIYPMIWNKEHNEPIYLKARGIPIGILSTWKGTAGSDQLQQGQTLLLTSDGITEATITIDDQTSPHNTTAMLHQTGLWKMLQKEPTPLILENLLSHIQELTTIQEDDQTLLALEVL